MNFRVGAINDAWDKYSQKWSRKCGLRDLAPNRISKVVTVTLCSCFAMNKTTWRKMLVH